ncbi:BTB/POZ domain-containing protein At3g49900 [Vigna unguiculata]|uniref:BTB/POZ domain-containing protein At3g49900 n=1 Tax=Vigna unguiculata TaxID=3917 RepID=UPI00101714DB|nr:BTB/POZ domain-containing protein At3g49900 [Vigna unguiculata]
MRGLNQLGAVETIYEEECEFSSTSSRSLSPSFSSSPASLHSRVKAWSLKIGRETDVLIRVQGTCFRLHKDRVVSQSSYLKRHLTETSDLTISPPLNITAETFAAVAEFCYNVRVQMTPANVAVIRTASEMLGMTAADGLSHIAETCFCEVVCTNPEQALTVLRSCIPLLPEAETTATLVSRCIEALVTIHGITRLNEVNEMQPRDFQIVAESFGRRFENHDVLYKMIDWYLQENKFKKVTEDERTGICSCIDCTKLSSVALVECVQNPRMPLRLVMRAVLVEHLNTRHSIAIASSQVQRHQLRFESNEGRQRRRSMTLGDFLHRDAALRQTERLKTAMDSTNARIGSLEEEMRCMNRVLRECEGKEGEEERGVLGSERSASFHFVPVENGRVKKGERWSRSSSRIEFDGRKEERQGKRSSFSVDVGSVTPKMNGTFRQRFVIGLRNAFRVQNSTST